MKFFHLFMIFPNRDCQKVPILGLDCEWVTLRGKNMARPVALIQIASYRGVCALVRMCQLPEVPETLKVFHPQ